MMNIVDLSTRSIRATGPGFTMITISENPYQLNNPEERENIHADDYLLHGEHMYVSSQWHEYVYGFPFNLE